jgi:hypothetical protein
MENRKAKDGKQNPEEKTDCGAVDGRASWGAAVLRPYKDKGETSGG